MFSSKNKFLPGFLVVFLATLILWYCIGKSLWHPNDYVYAFGGDAAILYYNAVFHTLFGKGLLLTNMNYPVHESIFMTDAQAIIAITLNQLEQIFPGNYLTRHIVGTIHSIHNLCIVLACVVLYNLLRIFNVKTTLAIAFSLLIIFLSPQLFRLRAGHFGLAYPIVIPLFLYLSSKIAFQTNRIWLVSTCLLFASLIFGLNNIYLLMISGGFILLGSIIARIWNAINNKKFFAIVVPVFMAIVVTYLLTKLSAPEMDRVEVQWGYFASKITLTGLITPPFSLLGNLFKTKALLIEGVSYIGLINVLGLLFISLYLIKFLVDLLKKRQGILIYPKEKFLISYLLSSAVLLVYASGFFHSFEFTKAFLGDKMALLTMFKASGRFAWPFFYIISIITVFLVNRSYHFFYKKYTPFFSTGLLLFVLGIWGLEDHHYLKNHIKFRQHSNHYHKDQLQYIRKSFKDNEINFDDYQAIYCLPIMEGWNDKLRTKFPFQTEFNATRISMATGLPMINGMLSRIGVTSAAKNIQFASHPFLEKEVITQLNAQKPILLVYGKDQSILTEGEQFLKDQSELLLNKKNYDLYSLDLNRLLKAQKMVRAQSISTFMSGFPEGIYFDSFSNDTIDFEPSLDWSLSINKNAIIADIPMSAKVDSNYIFSVYVYLENKRYGMPIFEIMHFQGDKLVGQDYIASSETKDIYLPWVIASKSILIADKTDRIQINALNIEQEFYIDNLMLRPISQDFCVINDDPTEDFDFCNNYLLRKE